MASFQAYVCDDCGKVLKSEEVQKRTIRLVGTKLNGEYTEDLCQDCTVLPPGKKLRPLRGRRARNSQAVMAAAAT